MAQLFNNKDFDTFQQSQNIPPIPPTPPQGHPIFQAQPVQRKPRLPLRTKVIGVIMIMVVVTALPSIVILSRQQQNFQGSAHVPHPAVSAACQNDSVVLSSSFTISDVPSGATCQINVTDSQNYLNDTFSYKPNDPPHIKTITVNQSMVTPGVVSFQTTCTSGFKKTDQASYSLAKPCASPTTTPTIAQTITPTIPFTVTPTPSVAPTVTPTTEPTAIPTVTETPLLTPKPTTCVTPAKVTNIKVTCSNCTNK